MSDLQVGRSDATPAVHRFTAPASRPAAPSAVEESGPLPLLVGLLSLAAFVVLTVFVASGTVLPFDQPWLALGRSWDGTPAIWHAVSESANYPLIAIGFALIAWLYWTKRRREALLVFLMLAAVTAGSEGVKQLVARPRPSGNGDGIPGVIYSYPSGHELEVLSILGIVAIRSWRSHRPLLLRAALAVIVVAEVALVGVARVALAEHYPSDVLAGLFGGIAALGIYAWLTRRGGWADRPPRDGARNGSGEGADRPPPDATPSAPGLP